MNIGKIYEKTIGIITAVGTVARVDVFTTYSPNITLFTIHWDYDGSWMHRGEVWHVLRYSMGAYYICNDDGTRTRLAIRDYFPAWNYGVIRDASPAEVVGHV